MPNPNMPLRDLLYVFKEYEKMVSKKTLYSSRRVKIPAPHFAVFYNGVEKQLERAVTECIKEGILEEFLRENRAEVISMSIFEFDEEREWKLIRETEYQYGVEDGREEGRIEGRIEGQRIYLIQNICKKLRKGKDIETIAEELEEEMGTVKRICDIALQFAPEYDVKRILEAKQG